MSIICDISKIRIVTWNRLQIIKSKQLRRKLGERTDRPMPEKTALSIDEKTVLVNKNDKKATFDTYLGDEMGKEALIY